MIARVKAECDGLESTFRKSFTSNHCKSHPTFKIRARRKSPCILRRYFAVNGLEIACSTIFVLNMS